MKKSLALVFFLMSTLFVTAQDWKTYTNKELGYETVFPDQTSESSQKIPTAVGEIEMKMTMCSTSKGDNVMYGVIFSEYPKEQFKDADDAMTKTVLDGAVQGGIVNVNGELVYEKNITLNGNPGRQIKVKITGAYIYMNLYLVNNIMYINQVICMENKEDNKSIDKFLNAFKLL